MPEISKTHMGGTMRLGLRPTIFQANTEDSSVRKMYAGAERVWERHRHRYEINPAYVSRLEDSGMRFIGKDEKGERMQIMELRGEGAMIAPESSANSCSTIEHPYFVGLQAHPEFCTRPLNPSPPFLGFVAASSGVDVLQEHVANQIASFTPPHPREAMVGEQELIEGSQERVLTPTRDRVLNGTDGCHVMNSGREADILIMTLRLLDILAHISLESFGSRDAMLWPESRDTV